MKVPTASNFFRGGTLLIYTPTIMFIHTIPEMANLENNPMWSRSPFLE
jgi:hypothetical protein